MYKTPTFAEPQPYNRPFSTGQLSAFIIQTNPLHRGCAGGRIGTRFLRPRGTSPLKGSTPGIEMGPRASSA